MKPIYGLIVGITSQKEIIEKWCFGKCGKIIVGVMVDDLVGEMGICRISKEDCPCFDRQMEDAYGDLNGDLIFIRKLKMPP